MTQAVRPQTLLEPGPGYREGVSAGSRIRLDEAIEAGEGRQQLAAAALTQGRIAI